MYIKHKVKLSTWSVIVSVLVLLVLSGPLLYFADSGNMLLLWLIAIFMVAWCFTGLYYAPLAISVDNKALTVHRPLRIKDFPISEIESVKMCAPAMAERRICGSGGFFGYWGWFSEKGIGRYFAYYGKSSDCFLVTLKNGRKYMLGCEKPAGIVKYLESRVGKRGRSKAATSI